MTTQPTGAPSLGPVGAVIWDLDDTLVVERAAAEAAMLATCEWAAMTLSVNPVQLCDDVFGLAKSHWRALPTIRYARDVGISSWEGLWATFDGPGPELAELRSRAPSYRQSVWRAAVERQLHPSAKAISELADRFIVERRARMRMFDDARSTIDHLCQRVPMVVVTNGAPDTQRAKVRHSGLDRFGLPTVISGDIGVGKPDPEPFERALRMLGVSPAQAVAVGDSHSRDIEPALELGLAALLLIRESTRQEQQADPHSRFGVISTLHEVTQIVEP